MPKVDTNVAVIGAGKMGLPLACQLASRGAFVTACDASAKTVASINAGVCPFDEPGLDDVLKTVIRDGHLKATCDTSQAVASSDVVIIIVPVMLTSDKQADTSIIESASADVCSGLKAGTMVCYETTLPVGGTRSLGAILEKGGLKAGTDFDLVFSPERVKSQLVLEKLQTTSKVVGGINERSAARAAEFYSRYLGAPVINVGTLEASELVKLAGMVYRDVNIALANELSHYADSVGVNISEVIRAANTDGEAAVLSPGIGVGGHCTPVYPYFLLNDAISKGVPSRLVMDSRWINDQQPGYLLDLVEERWGSLVGTNALILGLAFRPQVKESAYSSAFQIKAELVLRGAKVNLDDPMYSAEEIAAAGFQAHQLDASKLPELVILNTCHDAYRTLDFQDLARRGVQVVLDGRDCWDNAKAAEAGLLYIGVGQGKNLLEAKSCNTHNHKRQAAARMPITKPAMGLPEISAVARVIQSGWIMQGPEVARLENEFAEFVGAKYACATSSGTSALHLALLSVGVKPGDEVITVSHSFIATANSVVYCGAIPVFVDIESGTYNIDPTLIEAAITERTRAILCVHQLGMPCNMKAILAIANKHGIQVVEDAACAIGSEILWNGGWTTIGSPQTEIACFSFHPRKLLTTGDGGMLVTNSEERDQQFRELRNHGVSGSQYVRVGFNYRMTDIQAAIGREQLRRIPALVGKRRELAAGYGLLFSKIQGVSLPIELDWARSNWQSYCIQLPSQNIRDAVAAALSNQGVDTRPGVMCAHRELAYENQTWFCTAGEECEYKVGSCANLGVSESSQDCGLILPLYDQLTQNDQMAIASTLDACLAKSNVV